MAGKLHPFLHSVESGNLISIPFHSHSALMGWLSKLFCGSTMKKISVRFSTIYFFALLSCQSWGLTGLQAQTPDSTANPVTIVLKTYLEKNEIPQNQMFNFNIELSWVGDISRYQIVQIPQPRLDNLMLEGSGSANRQDQLSDGQLRSTKTIMFELKPVSVGDGFIESMEVRYRDSQTGETDVLHSQRIFVKITEPLPDITGGLKGVVYIVLLIIFGATVGYFLFIFLQKRKSRQSENNENFTREVQYLQRITQEVDPKGKNLREMFLRLGSIFREYLSGTMDVSGAANAKDWLNLLQQNGVDTNELKKLEPFFTKIDMIKFGGDDIDPLTFANLCETVEEFLKYRQTQ